MFWTQLFKTVITLFIITDSIGNLPFFMGLTEGLSRDEHRRVSRIAIFTGLILLAVFAFAGSLIFNLFNLTIDDMKIAGGILLLFIAIELMIKGHVTFENKEDVGVVPLGCPLLVGPGAITSVLMLLKIYNFYTVILGIVVCFVLIWLVFYNAESIYKILGKSGALIITKISAIVIAAIAVSFIRQGIQVLFHL